MKTVKEILNDIVVHNDNIIKNYSPTEKIDFTLTKKNWGTKVIPKKFWIDPTKKYTTRNGWNVENLMIVMENSIGNEVTFPIKGTYIKKRPGKSNQKIYAIWTLDGRNEVNSIESTLDLILKDIK